jgi:hypothetical protein
MRDIGWRYKSNRSFKLNIKPRIRYQHKICNITEEDFKIYFRISLHTSLWCRPDLSASCGRYIRQLCFWQPITRASAMRPRRICSTIGRCRFSIARSACAGDPDGQTHRI